MVSVCQQENTDVVFIRSILGTSKRLGGAFVNMFDTIPNALQLVKSRCEDLEEPKDQWMRMSVFPALEFVFACLQERNKTPADVEVVYFSSALSQLKHYLRMTTSADSLKRLARSRKVAESHNVVYSELERLLNLLEVAETDPIHAWKRAPEDVVEENETDENEAVTASKSAITLNYLNPSSMNHEVCTPEGLATATNVPSWYLSLGELVFNELGQIGKGAFGAVYKGS